MSGDLRKLRRQAGRVLGATVVAGLIAATAQGGASAAERSESVTEAPVAAPPGGGPDLIDQMPNTAPVELGRAEAGETTAPATSRGSISSVSTSGVRVEVDLPTADTAQAPTLTKEGTASYPGAGHDVEIAVQGLDTANMPGISSGVRSIIIVGSAQAPTQYEFPLTLPSGASPKLQSDGSVQVVNKGGKVLGAFGAPWAVDASGRSVPTTFAVEGNTLVQRVPHRGYSYPVIADPVWLVPVILAGARVAAPIVVKAATRSAAKSSAKRIAANRYKKPVSAVKDPKAMNYRSFTRSNFKHNLQRRTAKNPLNCQAHHMMPVKFETQFKLADYNIHDPKYGRWWISKTGLTGNHQSLASKYNSEWENYFRSLAKQNKRITHAGVRWKRVQLNAKYRKWYRC